ncbi:unnamed protein product [Rotaria sp. Silwood1]|nr:unnamed protein product [Rotaria sp. Silwood1]
MKCIFETLPNEILIIIFSYLSWLEMLDSLYESGLSYNKCYSKFISLLTHSSSLTFCSSIRNMCFDGTNSMACDINYEWIFQNNNEKKILHFSNLKSLIVTRCWLSESLIENLSLLIQNQLENLTLVFDTETFNYFPYEKRLVEKNYRRNLLHIFKRFLRQLFSSQCQLNSLRLDIDNCTIGYNTDECSELFSHSFHNSIFNEFQSYCTTLSRLHIHIKYTYFLEHLIEYTPALEQLSIKFNKTLNIEPRSESFIEKLSQSNEDWCNKVPKLRYFTLKTFIRHDLEFVYLKWLLNNINHVKNLKFRLGSGELYGTKQTIWASFIDANFVRQYCLPDVIDSIIDFNFYISSHCRVLSIDA